jgi:hypothetical protein
MIESNYVWVRGPSTWGIDNRQEDFNFTRHYTDAAPFKLKLPNCRKNKRPRITGNKKLVCGNKKDPTCNDFSRYSDNGSITEDQTIYDRNKNKIYSNNTIAQRIDVLMAHDERAGRFLRISYEFLFDSKKIKVKNRTSQKMGKVLHVH